MALLEYKYYFPMKYLDSLRQDILPFLEYDPHIDILGKKEYTVRSIYLDSKGLQTYYEKEAGIKNRNKYRIRGYDELTEDSIVFLEIKRKENEYITKSRALLLYSDLERFFRTKDFSLIKNSNDNQEGVEDARKFMFYYCLNNLRPAVVVTYDREAFECKFGSGLRITLDKNVRTKNTDSLNELFIDENMTCSFNDHFVLEVKFKKLIPSWLPTVLRKYNIMRGSVSKYLLSTDAVSNDCFNNPLTQGNIL